MLCDLEAWRGTQVPPPPPHRPPGQPPPGRGWGRAAGVATSRLAPPAPQPAGRGHTARPSLEDGLLAAWPGAFAWLVLAEPAGRAELEELTFGVFTAQGAAQRFDNPQAQLNVRRLQDRHAELRLAASTGLWRARAPARGGPPPPTGPRGGAGSARPPLPPTSRA